jgi:hypothetical protein
MDYLAQELAALHRQRARWSPVLILQRCCRGLLVRRRLRRWRRAARQIQKWWKRLRLRRQSAVAAAGRGPVAVAADVIYVLEVPGAGALVHLAQTVCKQLALGPGEISLSRAPFRVVRDGNNGLGQPVVRRVPAVPARARLVVGGSRAPPKAAAAVAVLRRRGASVDRRGISPSRRRERPDRGTKGPVIISVRTPSAQVQARFRAEVERHNAEALRNGGRGYIHLLSSASLVASAAATSIQAAFRSHRARMRITPSLSEQLRLRRAKVCLVRWWRNELLRARLRLLTGIKLLCSSIHGPELYIRADAYEFLRQVRRRGSPTVNTLPYPSGAERLCAKGPVSRAQAALCGGPWRRHAGGRSAASLSAARGPKASPSSLATARAVTRGRSERGFPKWVLGMDFDCTLCCLSCTPTGAIRTVTWLRRVQHLRDSPAGQHAALAPERGERALHALAADGTHARCLFVWLVVVQDVQVQFAADVRAPTAGVSALLGIDADGDDAGERLASQGSLPPTSSDYHGRAQQRCRSPARASSPGSASRAWTRLADEVAPCYALCRALSFERPTAALLVSFTWDPLWPMLQPEGGRASGLLDFTSLMRFPAAHAAAPSCTITPLLSQDVQALCHSPGVVVALRTCASFAASERRGGAEACRAPVLEGERTANCRVAVC